MGRKKKLPSRIEVEHDVPYSGDEMPPPEAIDAAVEFDIQLLWHPRSPYTVEEKIAACTAVMVTGGSIAAEKYLKRYCGMDIPNNTIRHWRTRSCWWETTYEKCKFMASERLQANYTQILDASSQLMLDKIHNGEVIDVGKEQYEEPLIKNDRDGEYSPLKMYKSKGGDLYLGPVMKSVTRNIRESADLPSRDLNRILGTIQDKLHLIQGKPTSISENNNIASPESVIKELDKKLVQFSKALLKEKQINSIPSTVVEKDK